MIVFDLDGTITDNRHRASVARACRAGACTWQEYSMLAGDDLPRNEIVDLVRYYDGAGEYVLILTGRNDVAEDLTRDWLWKFSVPYDQLIMRADKDHRENSKYKLEEIKAMEPPQYAWRGPAQLIYDDYKQVVQKLQKHGYNAIWVPPLWE